MAVLLPSLIYIYQQQTMTAIPKTFMIKQNNLKMWCFKRLTENNNGYILWVIVHHLVIFRIYYFFYGFCIFKVFLYVWTQQNSMTTIFLIFDFRFFDLMKKSLKMPEG